AEDIVFTVFPAEQRETDGSVRAYPQEFPSARWSIASTRDFDLDRPVRFSGVVSGEEVTPYAGNGGLPTLEVPVAGHVEVVSDEGEVLFTAVTDAATGAFEVQVQPGAWEARVVPDDATLAPDWAPLVAVPSSVRLDFALEPEQAIYGQILSEGEPKPGARVFATDLQGRTSGTATADDDGNYQLRVPSGTWEVATSGVENERDPLIRAEPVVVTSQLGAAVDLEYSDDDPSLVAISVEAADGSAVGGLPVRFDARSLEGFGAVELTVEALVANDGEAIVFLLPGVYDVTLAPPDGGLAGWAVEGLLIREGGALETVVLEPLPGLSGVVVDSGGAAVGGARVTCDEIGFAGRSWSAFTDGAGIWTLAVAPHVSCAAYPPGSRPDLAIVREELDLEVTTMWASQLPKGTPLSGTVTLDGDPEPFAVVEVRDASGLVIGLGLSDAEGNYALTLPPG
nr:hypothetical protein [Deltaproteobacteria bacterium]